MPFHVRFVKVHAHSLFTSFGPTILDGNLVWTSLLILESIFIEIKIALTSRVLKVVNDYDCQHGYKDVTKDKTRK